VSPRALANALTCVGGDHLAETNPRIETRSSQAKASVGRKRTIGESYR
jgi:hypothetical protein